MNSRFPTFQRWLGRKYSLPFPWPWYTTTAQRRGLLRMIAVSIEEKIPLVPLLESWAADERGAQRDRVFRLIRILNEGTPIADAVEQVPNILRDEDILAIRFDAQSGTVTAAARQRLKRPEVALPELPSRLRNTKVYFIAMLLVGCPLVAFNEIKIIPAFREIFSEFEMSFPPVTESFLRFTAMFADYAWLLVLALVVLALLFLFARPGRFVRHAMARVFGTKRSQWSGDLLRMIAIASNAGRPIAGALSTLARYHFDPTIRRKLLYVRNEIEQGAQLWQTMSAAELITPADERALDLSERLGNRSWVLSQLAYAKSRRAAHRLDLTSQLMLPIVVLLLGAFVLYQALAIFMPTVTLIQSLAV
jgi:protein transport protein HofC